MSALPRRCLRLTDPLRYAAILLALAAPVLGDTDLDRVRPGASGDELRAALGAPLDVDEAEGRWREDFAKPDAGLERVTVWNDADGVVQWARVVLVNDLKPRAAALLFDILGAPSRSDGHAFTEHEGGHFVHYASDGVHLFVEEGRVAEVWRTKPNADLAAIGAACGASYPPRPLEGPVPPIDAEGDDSSIITLDGRFDEGAGERGFGPDPSGAGEFPDNIFGDLGTEPSPPLARLLEVGPVTAVFEMDAELQPVLRITGPVLAHGLNGSEIRFEGYLNPPDMSGAIQAGRNAPADFRGPGGAFRPAFTDRIQFDRAEWKDATLLYPLRYAAGAGRRPGRFIVSLEVVCDDLAAFASAMVDVPGPGAVGSPPPPRLEQEPFRIEESEIEQLGKGFWVTTPLKTFGGQGNTVMCQVTLRLPGGKDVAAARGQDDWRAPDGRFYSMSTDEVLYADSSWEAFRVFVPYAALALEPGAHSLVVRQYSQLAPLGAAREAQVSVTIPAR